MHAFIALLRAVNVSGTGKLPMTVLAKLCEEAGLEAARTYIASGNVVFRSASHEAVLKAALMVRLEAYAGKPVGVLIRSGAEMAELVRRNPFPTRAGNRVLVIFLDSATGSSTLDGMTGNTGEEVGLGPREIYVHYPNGAGQSKLRIPAARDGTARNMNTAAKLADMAALC